MLFATPMAMNLYRRLGFREYCSIGQRVFGRPPADEVRQLQEALARLGYDAGGADGIYGNRTAAAVRTFQADHGIAVDGLVGPQTRRALDAVLAAVQGRSADRA